MPESDANSKDPLIFAALSLGKTLFASSSTTVRPSEPAGFRSITRSSHLLVRGEPLLKGDCAQTQWPDFSFKKACAMLITMFASATPDSFLDVYIST